MSKLKEVKNVLRVEEGKKITMDQLQKAKEIYKKQAQDDFKNKEYTLSKLCLKPLQLAFIEFLKENVKKDDELYFKSIFTQAYGYNAQLSVKNDDGTFNNLISVKFTKESDLMTLINDHGFHLV